MTVEQIIQEIEKLSPEERLQLKSFLEPKKEDEFVIRYVDKDRAVAVAENLYRAR